MAAISMEMQLVLYAVIVIVLGFAGYYVGSMYASPMIGAAIGVAIGLVISFIIYSYYGASEGYGRMMY